MLEICRYDPDRQILYPAKDSILATAENSMQDGAEVSAMNSGLMENLKAVVEEQEQDPLHELHEQECKIIWGLRHTCMEHFPSMLPKVLDCVEWNDHKEVRMTCYFVIIVEIVLCMFQVAKVICLLQSWPKLPAEKALELLDYAYADLFVRSFAVSCLEKIRYVVVINGCFPILK
jgi:phosphatidylinositol-4,5-bisphosphate 3-kinase